MATSLKNWQVETIDGTRVVRGSSAGMLLSDSINGATLYDHDAAKLISEQLAGMLSLSGEAVRLVVKSKNLEERK